MIYLHCQTMSNSLYTPVIRRFVSGFSLQRTTTYTSLYMVKVTSCVYLLQKD